MKSIIILGLFLCILVYVNTCKLFKLRTNNKSELNIIDNNYKKYLQLCKDETDSTDRIRTILNINLNNPNYSPPKIVNQQNFNRQILNHIQNMSHGSNGSLIIQDMFDKGKVSDINYNNIKGIHLC